jgi:hypothetical protein
MAANSGRHATRFPIPREQHRQRQKKQQKKKQKKKQRPPAVLGAS